MSILDVFKRKQTPEPVKNIHRRENVKPKNVAQREREILDVLEMTGVAMTARQIARQLGRDSSEVTPRMPKIVISERATVAYRKQGFDKRWRNFYKLANPQQSYIDRIAKEEG
jgi:F420-dependent methylenetetrahydromethanopterin dehydrogenase